MLIVHEQQENQVSQVKQLNLKNPKVKRKCPRIFQMGLGLAAMVFLRGGVSYSNPLVLGQGSLLETVWLSSGISQALQKWTSDDISQLKRTVSREKDLQSGKMVKWEGVLLSQLIEKTLEKLPLENRAQVDLVILKGKQGESASIPRAFVTKYPLMLAYRWEESNELKSSSFHTVVPWSTKPKVLNEELPLESYFLSDVTKIELTNYREKYGPLFLKRRTDPSAMRGEKLFVQNCVCCHSVGRAPAMNRIVEENLAKKFATQGHPTMAVSLRLSEKDRQSILRYLDNYRLENPVQISSRFQ